MEHLPEVNKCVHLVHFYIYIIRDYSADGDVGCYCKMEI